MCFFLFFLSRDYQNAFIVYVPCFRNPSKSEILFYYIFYQVLSNFGAPENKTRTKTSITRSHVP